MMPTLLFAGSTSCSKQERAVSYPGWETSGGSGPFIRNAVREACVLLQGKKLNELSGLIGDINDRTDKLKEYSYFVSVHDIACLNCVALLLQRLS